MRSASFGCSAATLIPPTDWAVSALLQYAADAANAVVAN
jgi:hypothetical protein